MTDDGLEDIQVNYKADILVVDDDKAICKSIVAVMRDGHCRVDVVHTAEEALEQVDNRPYAIMITDMMLPGIDGIQLLEKVKAKNPNISVILITGYPSIKTAVQSIKLSAFDYLPKPFTPEELRDVIHRALEARFNYEEVAAKSGIEEIKLVEAVR